jgi:hypothetical protein
LACRRCYLTSAYPFRVALSRKRTTDQTTVNLPYRGFSFSAGSEQTVKQMTKQASKQNTYPSIPHPSQIGQSVSKLINQSPTATCITSRETRPRTPAARSQSRSHTHARKSHIRTQTQIPDPNTFAEWNRGLERSADTEAGRRGLRSPLPPCGTRARIICT